MTYTRLVRWWRNKHYKPSKPYTPQGTFRNRGEKKGKNVEEWSPALEKGKTLKTVGTRWREGHRLRGGSKPSGVVLRADPSASRKEGEREPLHMENPGAGA